MVTRQYLDWRAHWTNFCESKKFEGGEGGRRGGLWVINPFLSIHLLTTRKWCGGRCQVESPRWDLCKLESAKMRHGVRMNGPMNGRNFLKRKTWRRDPRTKPLTWRRRPLTSSPPGGTRLWSSWTDHISEGSASFTCKWRSDPGEAVGPVLDDPTLWRHFRFWPSNFIHSTEIFVNNFCAKKGRTCWPQVFASDRLHSAIRSQLNGSRLCIRFAYGALVWMVARLSSRRKWMKLDSRRLDYRLGHPVECRRRRWIFGANYRFSSIGCSRVVLKTKGSVVWGPRYRRELKVKLVCVDLAAAAQPGSNGSNDGKQKKSAQVRRVTWRRFLSAGALTLARADHWRRFCFPMAVTDAVDGSRTLICIAPAAVESAQNPATPQLARKNENRPPFECFSRFPVDFLGEWRRSRDPRPVQISWLQLN